jgi:iron complex transport system substrate-binding protein
MVLHKVLMMLLAVVASLALVACGDDDDDGGDPTPVASATEAAAAFPVTITDSNGDQVTITDQPEAIVALAPSFTEVLFAIGAGDAVVATDDNTDYPEEAVDLPKISGFEPSVEAIAEYNPDLVFLFFDPGGLQDALGQAGIASLFLATPTSIDGIYEQIETIGTAAGHTAEAEALVEEMQADIDAIVAEAPGVEGPVIFHEIDSTLYSTGPGSFTHEMFELLGAENIAAETGEPYPQMSNEAVIAANPEIILLSDAAYGESFETVSARPGWDQISAVQNAKVFAIDDDLVSRAGPRIVDGMEMLFGIFYPEQ